MPTPAMHPQSRPCDRAQIRALQSRVAELEAERDRYLCALDRIATPGYCHDPQVEAAMVLGRIPKV